jgi:hypothetical protein
MGWKTINGGEYYYKFESEGSRESVGKERNGRSREGREYAGICRLRDRG